MGHEAGRRIITSVLETAVSRGYERLFLIVRNAEEPGLSEA